MLAIKFILNILHKPQKIKEPTKIQKLDFHGSHGGGGPQVRLAIDFILIEK